jgi:hypothetical protein
MKSLDYPVLFFEYMHMGEHKYLLLRNAEKGLKHNLMDFHETVKKIYDMHYFPVDICYEEALL